MVERFTIASNDPGKIIVRYNPPPNWPPPPHPGWQPPAGWKPDSRWGPAPPGWPLWIDDKNAPIPSFGPQTQQSATGPAAASAGPAAARWVSKPAGARRRLGHAAKHPAWVSIAAVVSALTVAVAIGAYLMSGSGPGELQLSAVTLDRVTDVQGARIDRTGNTPADDWSVGATPVDITLKNMGGDAATITAVEAELVSEEQIADCAHPGAGPAGITAEYSIRLPVDDRGRYQMAPVSMNADFTVEPGRVGRMVVTIGPEEQTYYYAQLLTVNLRLIQQNGNRIDLGDIVLITTQNQVDRYIELAQSRSAMANTGSQDCLRQAVRTLGAGLAADGTHSSSVAQLRDAYRTALA